MVEFTVLDESSAPEEAKPALARARTQLGLIPNFYGVLTESPQAFAAYQAISEQFQNSSLPNAAKQIVWLTASRQNGCTYCVAAHSAMAVAARVDDSVITAIRQDKPIDDAALEAVRRFTVQVVDSRGWVDDEDVQAFLDAGFTRRHILDVLTGVAQKTLSNYTNHLAHTPLDGALASYAWSLDDLDD